MMADDEVVEGVVDEMSEMSQFFGPLARPEGFTISFTTDEISLEALDILFGIDTRTIEGEVVQGELTDG